MGGEVVKSSQSNSNTQPINVEIYHKYKMDKLTDTEICKKIGKSNSWLTNWKSREGLRFDKHMVERKGRGRLEKLTVEMYNDLKASGLKDGDIAKRYNVTTGAIYNFKSVNGLSSKRIGSGKLQSKNNDVVEPNWNEVEQTVTKYFEKKNENQAPIDVEQLKNELIKKQDEINYFSSQCESLKTQNDKLRDYEKDYRNLEADYLNSQSENKRLLEMLEKLKRTAEINVWLMEQHVGFMNQVEKNEEAREFVWR